MLAIAKDIGAFAGYWFDDQGQLIVAMTDMSRSVDAERAVRLRMGSHETRVGHVDGTSVRIVTRGAKYSFLELVRYKTVLRPHVFEIEGVATLDANEVKNRVEIGTVTSSAEAAVRSTFIKLGVPEDAVVFGTRSYPRPATTNRGWAGEIYGQSVVQVVGRSRPAPAAGFNARSVSPHMILARGQRDSSPTPIALASSGDMMEQVSVSLVLPASRSDTK